MDPEPPQPDLLLALAIVPALLAGAYALGTSTLAALSPARRAALRDSLSGPRRAALDRYLSKPGRIEARWLLLRVTGVATTAAILGGKLGVHSAWGWAAAMGIAVLCYAIPSELGRRYTTTRAEAFTPRLIRWLRPGEWLVAWLADPLSLLAGSLVQDNHSRPPSASLTETEVELIVNEGELNGSLAHDQSEMIRNVLDFGDLTAEEVMIPRIHIHALEANLPLSEVMKEVTRTQHSRYPVYTDSVDNILGILHVKDLFPAVAEDRLEEVKLSDLVRKPVAFVPEGQLASSVLKDMRAGRHHMAVIIDEFGGFSGIVTLEDLLEEIVGDIQDEHDADDAKKIHLLGQGRALVNASLPITDINRELGTELPEGDYVSLGGLLLDQLGSVPATDSKHELLGLTVTVRHADAKHIGLVELGQLPVPPRRDSSPPRSGGKSSADAA